MRRALRSAALLLAAACGSGTLDSASITSLGGGPDMFADALGNPRFMQHDQIHPTAEGQMVVAENVLPGLRPLVLAALGR